MSHVFAPDCKRQPPRVVGGVGSLPNGADGKRGRAGSGGSGGSEAARTAADPAGDGAGTTTEAAIAGGPIRSPTPGAIDTCPGDRILRTPPSVIDNPRRDQPTDRRGRAVDAAI